MGGSRALDPRAALADRFYYGWVVAVACLLAATAVFGLTYSFGVFFERMLAAFAASRARLSLVFGVQTFVLYVGATASGGLVDRYGPRRMLLVGTGLLVGGLLATSRSRSFLALLAAYGLVTALGLSIVYVVAYASVPRWFGRRRGAAQGLATAGLGLGLVAIPPAADALIRSVGWRNAFVALAAGVGAVCLVVSLLFADDPVDVGADPSVEFPDGRADGSDSDPRGAATTALRRPSFLLVLLGWVFVYTTLYAVMSHLVLHVTDVGLPQQVGVTAIAVIGVTTSVARIGLGVLSDRVGRVRIFVVCSTLMGLSMAALAVAQSPLAVFAVVAAYGVGYGGNGALLSPLVADLFGNENLSTLYGILSVAFAVSGLAAPPVAGAVFERAGGYAPIFLAFGALGVVGAGCVGVAGRLATRE
ncbi:MAG: MFS transporter [Haloferacaceae archaeon]